MPELPGRTGDLLVQKFFRFRLFFAGRGKNIGASDLFPAVPTSTSA